VSTVRDGRFVFEEVLEPDASPATN
jgi:hypothetical protein